MSLEWVCPPTKNLFTLAILEPPEKKVDGKACLAVVGFIELVLVKDCSAAYPLLGAPKYWEGKDTRPPLRTSPY